MDGALAISISSTEQRALATFRVPETPGATVNIQDSSFVHVEGDANHYTFNPPTTDESGLQVLLQGIARDALYDSAERFPPPKCHPNTRTKILEEIETWINDTNTRQSVFWLHARAGEGKSAIMQSIAQKLSSPEGNVVATFFFGRGKGKREQGHYIFSTIAYQIALNVPDLRPQINRLMQRKPTIPSSAMDSQVQFLFAKAFAEWKDCPLVPFTTLIDGLDECNDHDDQQAILNLIGEIIITHRLPLRFLIASRPEPQIREVFDGPILQEITVRATIIDDFTSRMDITKFLRDRFADIYRRKSRFIGKDQGPNWPSDEVIEFLVSKSSGQFVYATTVVKFVDDKFRRPQEQLNIILSPALSQKEAFSYLDSLYMQILSTYPDTEALIRVLGHIVVMSKPVDVVIEDLLRVESGEVELVLQGLHSVLTGLYSDAVLSEEDPVAADHPISSTGNTREVHVAHASFSDFLVDPRRSDRYHIDKEKYDVLTVTSAFAVLLDYISDSIRGNVGQSISEETMTFIRDELHLNLRRLANLPESIFACLPSTEEIKRHLGPDSSIPLAVFLAVHKLITDTLTPGYEHDPMPAERHLKLLHLKHRYLLFLYKCYSLIIFREDHALHALSGLFAMREDLSSETLADLFMVSTEIVEIDWRSLGLHYHCSMLVETVNILRARYIVFHEDRDLCKHAERRNLEICSQLVLRLFKRNWTETLQPSAELRDYIRNYLATHLVGLIIVPSENDTVLAFLDILEGVQIQCEGEIDTGSSNKFKCAWDLLKAVFDWLSWQIEVSTKTGHSESFGERLQAASDHISGQMFLLISKTDLGHNEPDDRNDDPGNSNTHAIKVSDVAQVFLFIDFHISPTVDLEHLTSTAEAFFEVIRVWTSVSEIEENNIASISFKDVILDYLQAFDTIIETVEEGYKYAEKGKALVFQFRYTPYADDVKLYIKFIKTISSTGQEIAETALQRLWNIKQKIDQTQNDVTLTSEQGLEVTVLKEMLPYLVEETAKVLSWFVVGWRTMGIEEVYYLDQRPAAIEVNSKLKMETLKERYEEYSDKMGDLSGTYADVFKFLGHRPEARPKLRKFASSSDDSSSIILFSDSDSDSAEPNLEVGNIFTQSVVDYEPISAAKNTNTQPVQPDSEPLATASSDPESIQLDPKYPPNPNVHSNPQVCHAESSHVDSQEEFTSSPPQRREAEHPGVNKKAAKVKHKTSDSEKGGCCRIH